MVKLSKPNRLKTKAAKRAWLCCGRCDRDSTQLAGKDRKCPSCGFVEDEHKIKIRPIEAVDLEMDV